MPPRLLPRPLTLLLPRLPLTLLLPRLLTLPPKPPRPLVMQSAPLPMQPRPLPKK